MNDSVTSCLNASTVPYNNTRSHIISTTTLGCCMVVNNQNLISILLYSAQTWWYISHRIISSSSLSLSYSFTHSLSWEFIVAKGFIIIATVVFWCFCCCYYDIILYFVNMDMFVSKRGYENISIERNSCNNLCTHHDIHIKSVAMRHKK